MSSFTLPFALLLCGMLFVAGCGPVPEPGAPPPDSAPSADLPPSGPAPEPGAPPPDSAPSADLPPSGPPQPTSLGQAAAVPGQWDLKTPQPLPSFTEVAAKDGPGALIYGLYTWAGEYMTYRQAIRDVGWRAIRIAGPFTDELMRALAEDDMSVMVTLSNRLLDPAKGKNRTDYPSDEALIADYIAHVEAFVTRYGPGGTFFKENPDVPVRPVVDIEIWNEPNFQYLIPNDERSRAAWEASREKLYSKLLPATYTAIKKKHPEVNIIGFAAGGMSAGDLRFIQHVHEANAEVAKSYDTLSTHPYQRPAPPEANSVQPWGSYSIARNLAIIRETMGKFGSGSKPVWYTELGWPLSHADGGRYATPANKAFVTPRLQGAYVCRAYALALRLGVGRVHIMFISDTDNFNAGFFLREGTWRPSASAVQVMARVMPAPRLTGALSDGVDGYYAYKLMADARNGESADNEVVMAWNVAGPRVVKLAVPAETVSITDMMGETALRSAPNKVLTVEVGPYPIYITAKP